MSAGGEEESEVAVIVVSSDFSTSTRSSRAAMNGGGGTSENEDGDDGGCAGSDSWSSSRSSRSISDSDEGDDDDDDSCCSSSSSSSFSSSSSSSSERSEQRVGTVVLCNDAEDGDIETAPHTSFTKRGQQQHQQQQQQKQQRRRRRRDTASANGSHHGDCAGNIGGDGFFPSLRQRRAIERTDGTSTAQVAVAAAENDDLAVLEDDSNNAKDKRVAEVKRGRSSRRQRRIAPQNRFYRIVSACVDNSTGSCEAGPASCCGCTRCLVSAMTPIAKVVGSNSDIKQKRTNIFSSFAVQHSGPFCSAMATVCFCTSLLVWIGIATVGVLSGDGSSASLDNGGGYLGFASMVMQGQASDRHRRRHTTMESLTVQERTKLRTRDKHMGHLSDMGDLNGRKNKRKSMISMEALPKDCVRSDWQERRFVNCNELHGMDLRSVWEDYRDAARRRNRIEYSDTGRRNGDVVGYLSDGMWRTVWAVPDNAGDDVVVMKMMKPEHEVNDRNLDRHRRDALAMERLTASPYVVDIFGFCGNTVMTEYIGTPLDTIIHTEGLRRFVTAKEEEAARKNPATRQTPEGRLRIALEVAKGLQALHEIEGGPIVHADLQAKQFLVSLDGHIKINDFNRCRFVAHKNTTRAAADAELCPFRIPTSPGKWRSPEEYANQELTEKIDMFSLANVLHGILAGQDPWEGWSSAEVRKTVQKGTRPVAPQEFAATGSTDAALQNLTLRAYELDPLQRIGASELVTEIERLVSRKS